DSFDKFALWKITTLRAHNRIPPGKPAHPGVRPGSDPVVEARHPVLRPGLLGLYGNRVSPENWYVCYGRRRLLITGWNWRFCTVDIIVDSGCIRNPPLLERLPDTCFIEFFRGASDIPSFQRCLRHQEIGLCRMHNIL